MGLFGYELLGIEYTLLMKMGSPLFDIHLIKILLPGILMELHLKKT